MGESVEFTGQKGAWRPAKTVNTQQGTRARSGGLQVTLPGLLLEQVEDLLVSLPACLRISSRLKTHREQLLQATGVREAAAGRAWQGYCEGHLAPQPQSLEFLKLVLF